MSETIDGGIVLLLVPSLYHRVIAIVAIVNETSVMMPYVSIVAKSPVGGLILYLSNSATKP